ncbi:uncharacterized protein LOC143239535 isoform X1 [Tachypleus tridentatus]|uniref:uncharacterized protein LOC143239535 isoform X1 n=1 Tax=Tachypleus tridentatus TaxID=6853 RepID=UPI003FD03587
MDASDGRAAEFTTLQTARAYREHRQTHTGQGRGEPRVVGGPFVSLGRMSAGNQDLRKYGNNVTGHQTADKQPFLLVSHRGLSTYHKHPTEVATSLPSGSTLLVDNTMSAPLLLRDILACKKGKHMEKRYPIRPGLRPLINNLTRHEDSVHSDF